MKKMPYTLKQKFRQYDSAQKKSVFLHDEIVSELEKYGVPYDNLTAVSDPYGKPYTEGLAFINNAEGDVEDNINEIEEVFLHFVNNE